MLAQQDFKLGQDGVRDVDLREKGFSNMVPFHLKLRRWPARNNE